MPMQNMYSGEEVLELMDAHRFDPEIAFDEAEEEDLDLAAEPTEESGSWGWMAFGALATANAAYVAVNAKRN